MGYVPVYYYYPVPILEDHSGSWEGYTSGGFVLQDTSTFEHSNTSSDFLYEEEVQVAESWDSSSGEGEGDSGFLTSAESDSRSVSSNVSQSSSPSSVEELQFGEVADVLSQLNLTGDGSSLPSP